MVHERTVIDSERVECAEDLLEENGFENWLSKFVIHLKSLDVKEVV